MNIITFRIRKTLIALMLSALLSPYSFAQEASTEGEGKDKDTFTTTELIDTSASGLFDCGHYCIVGFQIRFIIVYPGKIETFYTPVVRHNTADLITMSAAQTEEQPWLDYRNIFGKNAKQIGDAAILAANSTGGASEVGGGPSQYKDFGKKQSLNFKDADVAGNPMAYVVEELGAEVKGSNKGSGSIGIGKDSDQYKDDNKKPSEEETDEASNDYLEGMGSNEEIGLSDDLYNSFQGEMYKEMVKNNTTVQMYKEIVEQIVDSYKDSLPNPAVVDYYGCDSDATPFKPFYVSNVDGVLWRDGYPTTDAHKSTTIINPLSKDYIKPSIDEEGEDSSSMVGDMAGGMSGGWGHLYPRSGFLNSTDDYKLGTVIAARGMNIASESGKYRIKQNAGGTYDSIIWQQIHPTPVMECYNNIANSIKKEDNNLKRNYAWNGWRRYQCGLTKKGGLLAEIVIGELFCIGNPPKDR